MSEQVSAAALLAAVADFLKSIEPELAARSAFHAKVAGNALAIVTRELAQAPQIAERAALAGFMGHHAGLDGLRAELCGRLRSGQLTPETPGLIEALTVAVIARVRVDSPRYSTLARIDDSHSPTEPRFG